MSSVPYISEDTVSKLLTWEVAFQAVEAAMECVAKDPATQNHRTFTTVPETQTLLLSMPGYLDHAKFGALACKLVTVGPTNSQLQLPTINANIMLFDEVTGVIKAIVAGTGITTWRTAAASAVATKHLKPDSSFRVLAVLGAGVQGRIHAIAFQHFFSFEEIRIWNRSKRRAQQLVDELNGSLGARVLHFESNEECVRGADVVVTATSSRGPLVELEWLKPGAHINAVGAGADHVNELAGSIYSTGEIYVDHRSGAERELKTLSELGVEFKGEVGGVICGDLPRPASDRITVFQSLDMAPWYELVIADSGWKKDANFLKTIQAKNAEEIKKLDAAIEDAEKNLGEMEVREAYLKKAEYYSRIGDKENAVTTFRQTYDKTVSLGHRLDIIFHLIRIGLFFMDHDIITRNIDKAKTLIEEGGDWDRRNRLKVYQGAYCMAVRDFKTAANLFLDTVSTFTSYELMDYKAFVRYTVYTSIISLPRNQLRDKVVKGSEILEVLHSEPFVKDYLFSLYNCQYSEFFNNLAEVETVLRKDYFLNPHYRYYIREMKILAYTQLLESYRSLTLQYMAEAFGVTVEFVDEELSTFIAAGRLHCKIDRVGGIVETNRPDLKNAQFNSVVKQGDLLLTRVQKLSRVINI